jgi:hypothetical protein
MPPTRSKVTFSADSLFDFDKSTVKPAGRIDLDKFAVELKGVEFDVITVTGHTDRIGTQAYNQKLSERRAEAVNSYLVETAGVAGNKISAKGVNGSDPVTKPGDCKGTKVTQALIACLQPDRRVDIEVTGKRSPERPTCTPSPSPLSAGARPQKAKLLTHHPGIYPRWVNTWAHVRSCTAACLPCIAWLMPCTVLWPHALSPHWW